MIKVSTTGMAVSLKTDLRFPISGQWGHGDRIIQTDYEITREELSECHTLCHGNWIEIERKYKYIQELKKILSDHEIPYPEEYEIE